MTETLRGRCARAIDTSWHHSWHWPKRDWEPVALEQAKQRKETVIAKLIELQNTIKELEDYIGDNND